MSTIPQLSPQPDPQAAYTTLRAAHQQTSGRLAQSRGRILAAVLASLAALFLFAFRPIRDHLPGVIPLLALFALFVFLVSRYLKLQAAIETQSRLLALYDTALARVDGTEPQSGLTGPTPPPHHLYARDLDLFGPDSLFGLLATVRTTIGESGLTRFLLDPVPHTESQLRQQAVRELAPQTRIREQIALLGASHIQRISATLIDDWLAAPAPTFPAWLRPTLAFTAALATAILAFSHLFHIHTFTEAIPRAAAVLALQAAICYPQRQKFGELLTTSTRLQGSIRLLAEGLALLESLTFTSPLLITLQQQALQPAGAVRELRRLQNLLTIAEQRGQGYFLPLSLLLAAGAQTAISLAAFKRRHASSMRAWITAWADFEALNALATYAFEHPQNAWPDLLPPTGSPTYQATQLGHPLLPGAVLNDVSLGTGPRFYLISGSNMSGKSTLLRSIGINAVLARAGAPVHATSLRLTPLTLGASLALTDSLAEGTSKFKAEVARLSALVAAARHAPVLFLVDEIFSGTNSADRRTAAAAVLRTLLAHGAIGALSTHDLALTELATEANAGLNLHMASPNPDDPLAFDYKLKPGVNTSSNALAIVRMMGLTD